MVKVENIDTNLNILHISNGYAVSKVHANLIQNLEHYNVSQTVYCPVRTADHVGKNQFESQTTSFVFSHCIKSWYRYVYHWKQFVLYKDLKNHLDLSKFDIIHASTLFSDGILAYRAYKEFSIPYVVAVRATDIYDFIGRKMYHTWSEGRKILLNARKIYFISAAGMKQFEKTDFVQSVLNEIRHKFVLRPNGIDSFWLENINHEPCSGSTLCYIGTFLRRKNLDKVIQAVKSLRNQTVFSNLTLCVIGGGQDDSGMMERLIQENTEFIDYRGKITDKSLLMSIMRQCSAFVMPSVSETFGLVYVEALSQNLPVIYTKDDGIDGIFDDTVGLSVVPDSVDSISDAIKSILTGNNKYENSNVDFSTFDWKNIASQYSEDYKTSIRL